MNIGSNRFIASLAVLEEGFEVERLYSREELAEILNVDPELIDFYLLRSSLPIKKDIDFCRYDVDYFDEIFVHFEEEKKQAS